MRQLKHDTLGARLRSSRIVAGLSQEDLAISLNLSRSAVSQWEKDQTEPSGPNLRACAVILKVDIGYLQTGKGPRPKFEKPKKLETFRRQWMRRMQLMIATGRFDHMLSKMGYIKRR